MSAEEEAYHAMSAYTLMHGDSMFIHQQVEHAWAAQHRLLFENAHVRVFDTRIAPGEVTPAHTHRWPAPEALWGDARPPHSLENVGTSPIHVISTEIKSATPHG